MLNAMTNPPIENPKIAYDKNEISPKYSGVKNK
jgi:hypothetical protein